jgi:hypothetical protein
MHAAPEVLYYAGQGGTEGFLAMLGAETEDGRRMVRDLAPVTASSVPKGLAAGVMGALAS